MAANYKIDPNHSDTGFTIRHLVSKVRGNFTGFSGTVQYDSASPESGSVTFEIDAASINTGNEQRDNHLRSAEFFDVEKFPKITFTSKSFKKTGDQTFDVAGTLTMHGVSKEIVLPVSFLGEAGDPWGNTRAGFETSIVLNRKDYGINWNAALDQGGYILGDDVTIEINLESIKEKMEMMEKKAEG
ncbi:MAG: YceI family protein [Acidobacteria bacterium]|nr:YceI family protein [Acidobacteriota bacterium]